MLNFMPASSEAREAMRQPGSRHDALAQPPVADLKRKTEWFVESPDQDDFGIFMAEQA